MAEAAKNAAEFLALQKIGCDVVQGSHLDAPLSCVILERLIEEPRRVARRVRVVRQIG